MEEVAPLLREPGPTDKPYARIRRSWLNLYSEVLKKDSFQKLSPEATRFVRNLIGAYYHDALHKMDADLSNARSMDRPALHRLTIRMHQHGLNNFKAYCAAMRDKWDAIYEKERGVI